MEGPLPPSSLRLLVPPLRVMSAAMWRVVHLRNFKHYGKVEEFVSVVSEAVPAILTDRQMTLLSLGLRTKMLLQMLNSEESEDLKGVKKHFDILLQTSSRKVDAGSEALEANFARLVQRLLEDSKEREHFIKNLCPVQFGPDFDTALETLLCEFLTKLEELVLIPDFKQTAEWISDAPAVLDDYMHGETKADDLKELLRSKLCSGQMAKTDPSVPSASEQQLFSSLSLPASLAGTCTNYVDSNMQTLEGQRESEVIAPQEGRDFESLHTKLPHEESNIVNSAEQASGGKCTDSILEEYNDQIEATSHAPSVSDQSPVKASSMKAPPKERVAHKCPQCAKCFIYRCELLEHQRVHTGESPYKCSQCEKAFRRASDLSFHRRTRCKNAGYVCIKCGKIFPSVQDRLKHKRIHGVRKDCSVCGKTFSRRSLLEKHELNHKLHVFTCRRCGEVYPSISELKFHQRSHPPVQSNQCKQCGKFFSSAKSLTAHKICHTQEKKEICAVCGKAFMRKSSLDVHMRIHTGEKPFECSYCGKRFSMSGNLNIHVRIHTGEKPYPCSDCGKAFVSAGELQIHRRTHTGERPYKCLVCGKGFTMAYKLTVHKRVHTGERPYVCSKCGKGFSRGAELNKHSVTHTGIRPYSCQHCAKTYLYSKHLKTHLKTHNINQTT